MKRFTIPEDARPLWRQPLTRSEEIEGLQYAIIHEQLEIARIVRAQPPDEAQAHELAKHRKRLADLESEVYRLCAPGWERKAA